MKIEQRGQKDSDKKLIQTNGIKKLSKTLGAAARSLRDEGEHLEDDSSVESNSSQKERQLVRLRT